MGVLDGQAVSAAITNPAFINKNLDDTMPNKLSFNRALSGSTIADIQAATNKLYTATGASESTTGTVYNAPAGTIANGNSYQTALSTLAHKFDASTGHMHTGADGDGPLLDVVRSVAVTGSTPIFGDIILQAGAGLSASQLGNTISISNLVTQTTLAASGYSPLTGNVVLVPGANISISQSSQLITISSTGGGGGGGGSLQWIENVQSPTPVYEYGNLSYSYDAGLAQYLTAAVKVPNSYVSGSPVTLKTFGYSAATSGTLLFQSISTLIRFGVDAMTSTTNQRTSTNTAITLSGGTVNIPQAVSFDLSSASGQINGVSLSAGDLIIVQLKRGTDTSTLAAKALLYATELTFS
jgi:hypothetical protein